MPTRSHILHKLKNYHPHDASQRAAKDAVIDFVKTNHDCFLRSNLAGHITGSAWLLSPDEKEVLLTHHKKLGAWLQLGGHADGDFDVLRVAMKEAEEESGITGITALSEEIFDVDIHEIPEHKGVPKHFHYDLRFSLRAPHKNFLISDESNDLAWISIDQLAKMSSAEKSLRRMSLKWLKENLQSVSL